MRTDGLHPDGNRSVELRFKIEPTLRIYTSKGRERAILTASVFEHREETRYPTTVQGLLLCRAAPESRVKGVHQTDKTLSLNVYLDDWTFDLLSRVPPEVVLSAHVGFWTPDVETFEVAIPFEARVPRTAGFLRRLIGS